jgi:hypothetical protein
VRGGAEIALDSFLHNVGVRLKREGLERVVQEIAAFKGIVSQEFEGQALFPLKRRIGAYRSIMSILGEVIRIRRPHESVKELIEISNAIRAELHVLEVQWQREHRSRLDEGIG